MKYIEDLQYLWNIVYKKCKKFNYKGTGNLRFKTILIFFSTFVFFTTKCDAIIFYSVNFKVMKGGCIMDNFKEINSEVPGGLKELIKGYADYATEVVLERAIPAIDGFKPSQRRIAFTMYRNNNKHLTKSANVVGEVMKLHPHGDGAIYETLVHMVDEGQYMNVPYISGKGNFGKVYFTEGAAASRYTECMLSPESELLFGEMDGVDMVPSYDNKFTEPSILPVAFPSILANPTQGIAVGMASNIPAFNLVELNNATIELIETGSIKKPLAPDYCTGAVYIKDEAELEKIMKKGKGKIKLRGKWHIEGKSYVIDEIPYYTNVDRIKSVMENDDNVADVRDESDFHGLRLVVECRSKARMEEVLVTLLRDTSMQMSITTNISVIINNKPKSLGVVELLNEWVKFRRRVLKKQLKLELMNVRVDIDKYSLLVKLLNDQKALNDYIQAVRVSEVEGKRFLRDFGDAYNETYDWIMGLSFKSISNIKNKEKKLSELKVQEQILIGKIDNIDKVICDQLREINRKYGKERKTTIGTDDYVYNKAEKAKPEAVKCYVIINDKFIKKCQVRIDNKAIECMSDSNILFIDSKARMLRLDLSEIEFYRGGTGVYLPVALGIDDDFRIIDYRLEQHQKSVYFYRDGYVSVVDWGSRMDSKKKYKVYQRAVSPYVESAFSYLPNKPYVVCLTTNRKIGVASTNFTEKTASARTKIIDIDRDDEIWYACGATLEELLRLCPSFSKYMNKCKRLKAGDTFDIEYFKELVSGGCKT